MIDVMTWFKRNFRDIFMFTGLVSMILVTSWGLIAGVLRGFVA